MDYTELFNKAKKDLENVRIQKAQIENKIKELVSELGLDQNVDLSEQAVNMKKSLEESQKELSSKLDKLAEELKSYEQL